MERPQYIDWVIEENGIVINDDIPLRCYKIDYKLDDEVILNDWALHIRRNYIEDIDLKEDSEANGKTAEQYLREYIIPQIGETLGPSARSADITEILISDLLEFVYKYSVPRYKLKNRSGKNNSEHGTDVIAYKFKNKNKVPSEEDELIAIEVKAKLKDKNYIPIKNAIIDSRKDEHRLARTIDNCRKKLRLYKNKIEFDDISRFLKKPDNNYCIRYAAAGVSSCECIDNNIQLDFSNEEITIRKDDLIFFLHGNSLMKLVNEIYERCRK